MRRVAVHSVLTGLLAMWGCEAQSDPPEMGDARGAPAGWVSDTDAEMNAATESARDSFAQFRDAFRDCEGCDLFMVKVRLDSDDLSERKWIEVTDVTGDVIKGTTYFDSRAEAGPGAGHDIVTSPEAILDWGYDGPDGHRHGHFTTRLSLSREPEGRRAELERSLGFRK